jgi:16S rRNA (cytidine1402-2'-O)-methyltransferase
VTTTSSLLAAAAAAAGAQQYPVGALYVVATPIGNLADLTLRAIHVLALADAVACEDTRVTAGLLRHLGLHRPMLAVHEHNEHLAAKTVIDRLARGERVALLSDAGTPAISDPGAALVAAVRAAGHRCVPVPGASAVMAALSVAGDVSRAPVCFAAFLPSRGAARGAALDTLARSELTQVVFEAPHRIAALLKALAQACPARTLTLARELTKQFEEIVTLSAAQAPGWIAADAHRLRGEYVVVLHAAQAPPSLQADEVERVLGVLLRELALKQAVALAAELTGAPRNALYERALARKQGSPPPR